MEKPVLVSFDRSRGNEDNVDEITEWRDNEIKYDVTKAVILGLFIIYWARGQQTCV